MTYREYAEKMYNEIFSREYTLILDKRKSESAKKDAERQAQHIAMLETFETAYEIYSDENNAADIWNSIYSAHLRRKVGTFDSSDLNETV